MLGYIQRILLFTKENIVVAIQATLYFWTRISCLSPDSEKRNEMCQTNNIITLSGSVQSNALKLNK